MLVHPRPHQLWRTRHGVPVEHVSSHETVEEARAAGDAWHSEHKRPLVLVDMLTPSRGAIATWAADAARRRGLRDQMRRRLDALRMAPAGTPIGDLDLSPRLARRLVAALSEGHIVYHRLFEPIAPARGTYGNEVQIAVGRRRGRLVVTRNGEVDADPLADPTRLVVAIRTLEDWHGAPAVRRELRRLLGWSLARIGEVLEEAEDFGWVRLSASARIGVTREGRARVDAATPVAAVRTLEVAGG